MTKINLKTINAITLEKISIICAILKKICGYESVSQNLNNIYFIHIEKIFVELSFSVIYISVIFFPKNFAVDRSLRITATGRIE